MKSLNNLTTIISLTACPEGCPYLQEFSRLNDKVNQLTGLVATDPLTGIFNRRHLFTSLDTEMERTRRCAQATSIVMMDIDHFKSVNDRYGHLAGDTVLRQTAEILLRTLRKIDIPCRYGGEEFAIILPSTPLQIAAEVAERLRKSINETKIKLTESAQLSITASFGVATFLAHHAASQEELMAQVDRQLYQAKNAGRNRVCFEPAPIHFNASLSPDERNALFQNEETPL